MQTNVPKMIAQKCPVCNGYRTVGKLDIVECSACSGKGYIWGPNGAYEALLEAGHWQHE